MEGGSGGGGCCGGREYFGLQIGRLQAEILALASCHGWADFCVFTLKSDRLYNLSQETSLLTIINI